MIKLFDFNELNGGGRGIRTPGTLSGTTVFKTAGINRSPIPPREELRCCSQFNLTIFWGWTEPGVSFGFGDHV